MNSDYKLPSVILLFHDFHGRQQNSMTFQAWKTKFLTEFHDFPVFEPFCSAFMYLSVHEVGNFTTKISFLDYVMLLLEKGWPKYVQRLKIHSSSASYTIVISGLYILPLTIRSEEWFILEIRNNKTSRIFVHIFHTNTMISDKEK